MNTEGNNNSLWYEEEKNKIKKKQTKMDKAYKVLDYAQYMMVLSLIVSVGFMIANGSNTLLLYLSCISGCGLGGTIISKVKIKEKAKNNARRLVILSQVLADEEDDKAMCYLRMLEKEKTQEYKENTQEYKENTQEYKEKTQEYFESYTDDLTAGETFEKK